jgi:anti-sigma regulatory factor (Ser/Thr protein kinase)
VDAYDDVPLNTAVRTGTPVVGDLEDLDARYAQFVERQSETSTAAVAAVPITSAGQTLGGYVLFFDRRQAFDRTQRLALEQRGAGLGSSLNLARRRSNRSETATPNFALPGSATIGVHTVTPEPSAVGRARRFMEEQLNTWGVDAETTYAAVLCVSEVVTNAIIHAHAGCEVRVLLAERVLKTTVRDSGAPDTAAVEGNEDPLRVHGYGLQVLDALATRWGSRFETTGTTVWFDLAL